MVNEKNINEQEVPGQAFNKPSPAIREDAGNDVIIKNQEQDTGFEARLARLQEIVSILENENTPLEESLAVFEEGVKISKELSETLDNIKQKIEILKKDAEGKLQLRPFDEQ